jgi:hypothetical protein
MVGGAVRKQAPSLRLTGTNGSQYDVKRGERLPVRPFIILRPSDPSSISGIISGSAAVNDEECEPEAIECTPEEGGGGFSSPGSYIDRFFPGQDDGWFGDVEVSFLFGCEDSCHDAYPNGTHRRRDVEPYAWHNEDIYIFSMNCSPSTRPLLGVVITEIDGDANSPNDDWGTLTYPDADYDFDEESWIGNDFMIALRMHCQLPP